MFALRFDECGGWLELFPLDRWLCPLDRRLCPLGRLLLGAGRSPVLFTGIDCALCGARLPPRLAFPPRLLLGLFVDPNREENTPPPPDLFLLPELWRGGEEAFRSRCRLADLIS